MIALYRSGRPADALTAYERTRRRLAESLGSDPGQELRRVHQMVLREDLRLDAATAAPAPVSGSEVPRQLPPPPGSFLGRTAERERILEWFGDGAAEPHGAPVVAIHGPGGIGKSALALHAAHLLAPRYPDGQLYVDLQGAGLGVPPVPLVDAAGRFLRALGLSGPAIPATGQEAAAKVRTMLADRRVLVVLDNAADVTQVRPLLPANPDCAVLVTSRTPLTTVDRSIHIALRVLSRPESVGLLTRWDRTGRVAADPASAERIAELCGDLPLALRIAAARIAGRPEWAVSGFVRLLTDQQRRLDHLGYEDLSVRACFQVSYRALDDSDDAADRAAAAAFRLLGLPDGQDIGLPIAARLLDMPESEAQWVLERLVDAQLLDSVTPGRYRQHDLLRIYARELATEALPEPERYAALGRTWQSYVATVAQTGELVRPGRRAGVVEIDPAQVVTPVRRGEAVDWLVAELPNVRAAARQAAAAAGDWPLTTVRLAHGLFGFCDSYSVELREVNLEALQVARARGDRRAEARVLNDLGLVAWRQGDGDAAEGLISEALALRRALDEPDGVAGSLVNLGYLAVDRGRSGHAFEYLDESLALFRRLGSASGEAACLTTMARARALRGETGIALDLLRQGRARQRQIGDEVGVARSIGHTGRILLDSGRAAEAIGYFERALATCDRLSVTVSTGWLLAGLGEAHRRTGDAESAARLCTEALSLSRRVGLRTEEAYALHHLGLAVADLGDDGRARQLWREAVPIYEDLGYPEAAELRRVLGQVPADR